MSGLLLQLLAVEHGLRRRGDLRSIKGGLFAAVRCLVLVAREGLILCRVNCVVHISLLAASVVWAVDVRFKANLLGLTLHRLALVVVVVLFEELVCRQVTTGAIAAATALLGKHVA